jgi:hypothetical protein
MDTVVGIVNGAFIAFISYLVWLNDRSQLKPIYWPALLFKLFSGIVLGLLYTFYYNVGDTFNYFNDGVRLADLGRQDAGSYISFLWSGDESFPVWSDLIYKQPRAMFLSKVTSLFCILTADNYWFIALYFSAVSFFSAWLLGKKIQILWPDSRFAVAIAFFFFPSVVFWSSGVIKESLAMAALFCLCFIFLRLWANEKVTLFEWLITILAGWMLWSLKYYYLAVFLPVAATVLMARWSFSRMKPEGIMIKIVLWCLIFVGPLLLISVLHPNFYPERFLEVVVSSYREFLAISSAQDVIHYDTMEPTPSGIVKNIPLAIFSGLYRPFFTEARTVLQFLSAAENFLLLTLTATALIRIKKVVKGKHRLLTFSLMIFIIVLCIFLALSAPNFGTLSRYRVGFLPFFVFLLIAGNPLVTRLIKSKWPANLAP